MDNVLSKVNGGGDGSSFHEVKNLADADDECSCDLLKYSDDECSISVCIAKPAEINSTSLVIRQYLTNNLRGTFARNSGAS